MGTVHRFEPPNQRIDMEIRLKEIEAELGGMSRSSWDQNIDEDAYLRLLEEREAIRDRLKG